MVVSSLKMASASKLADHFSNRLKKFTSLVSTLFGLSLNPKLILVLVSLHPTPCDHYWQICKDFEILLLCLWFLTTIWCASLLETSVPFPETGTSGPAATTSDYSRTSSAFLQQPLCILDQMYLTEDRKLTIDLHFRWVSSYASHWRRILARSNIKCS